MKRLRERIWQSFRSIQSLILVSFTVTSILFLVILTATLYERFSAGNRERTIEHTEQLLEQTAVSLEDYLLGMRRISDAIYYDVIKDKDLAYDALDDEMNLLYEAHKDTLVSVALFRRDGRLQSAAPLMTRKGNVDATEHAWFTAAMGHTENLHFSTPHVQNLFDDSSYRYNWVISLSRQSS